MRDIFLLALQFVVTLSLAPLLTGWVRFVKARLTGRRGASPIQPYRELLRLLKKEVVLAHQASWLFRVSPYLIFSCVWMACVIVPTFALRLPMGPTADLIALVALLGTGRFLLALAGMDIGTSFGGLGSSREMMIATLAEPAMLMVTFMMALYIHSTYLPSIAAYNLAHANGLHVSLVLALISLSQVAIAENARIPVDNPSTHLELTMVHEAMVLEYSGRHLALIEGAAMLKLALYMSLISCLFIPYGLAESLDQPSLILFGILTYVIKLMMGGLILGVFETSIAKMRIFRVAEFLGSSLLLGLLAIIFQYLAEGL